MELDQKLKDQLKLQFATQSKLALYNKHDFRFLHSMGIWNIVNAFTYTTKEDGSDQPKPFGVLQLYWDKDAVDNVVTPDGKPWMKGMWKHKWYEPGETVQAVTYWDRCGITEEGKQKIEKIFTDLRNKSLLKQFELASQSAGNEDKKVIIN